MKTFLGILGLLLGACSQSQSADLVIQSATIVSVTDGSLAPDRTVFIKGNRIARVQRATEVRVPDNAEVIDAAGAYLIPGLWDMHTHSLEGRCGAG
jgi:imidazolonepropionase-like amidohydrolase